MFYIKSGTSYQELTDEEALKKAKQLAINYVFAIAARWYENVKSEDLQGSSDLRLSNLLFYPFYFATANGHSRALFDCLGEFRMTDFGPLSNQMKFFIADKGSNNYFDFTTGFKLKYDSTQIIEQIKTAKVNNDISFGDLFVKKDDGESFTNISLALESSQRALAAQTEHQFLDYSILSFKKMAKRYYDYYPDKIGEVIKLDIIEDRVFQPA